MRAESKLASILPNVSKSYLKNRKEKPDFARNTIGENRFGKRFIQVLRIYVQNYLILDGVIVNKGFVRSGSLEKAIDEYLNNLK